MTIVEAIKTVLRKQSAPMTIDEIYAAIVADMLFSFSTKNAKHVVATQIRRHLKDSPAPGASTACFKQTAGNRFAIIDDVVRQQT